MTCSILIQLADGRRLYCREVEFDNTPNGAIVPANGSQWELIE